MYYYLAAMMYGGRFNPVTLSVNMNFFILTGYCQLPVVGSKFQSLTAKGQKITVSDRAQKHTKYDWQCSVERGIASGEADSPVLNSIE